MDMSLFPKIMVILEEPILDLCTVTFTLYNGKLQKNTTIWQNMLYFFHASEVKSNLSLVFFGGGWGNDS